MIYNIKSKNIGVFSDIHIGLGQDSPMWHKSVLEFAEWVKELYSQKGINDIIIPGDIFHNRNEISVNTLNIAKEFFSILKDFRIFISTGNHDCYYKDRSDVNSISMLDGWDNIVIIDKKPIIISADNKTISLIPWGTELNDIPKSDICFGHFEIQSFYMNSFKVCDHGFESQTLLDKSPLVLSGHFHKRELRKYDKGKILYIGSPYQQNFGDTGDDRGVYILNTETEKIEFFENEVSPKHIKISLNSLQCGKQDSQYLKDNVPDNIVSFIIDKNIEPEKIPLLSSKIQNLGPKFFRIDYKLTNNDTDLSSDNIEYTAIDIPKSIKDFVESLEVPHKDDIVNYLDTLYTKLT
jgi:DNA repair exonuclease SbcCD nuclease subunit